MLDWASKDVEVVFVRCRTLRAVVVFLITLLYLFPSCAKETRGEFNPKPLEPKWESA
jgi:hypothetical protein